jgi:CxxC motif-containing protein
MGSKGTVICVGCPMGCEIVLTIDDNGEVSQITGNSCKEGKTYAVDEYRNPLRVLTATVLTEHSCQPLLSVRTDRPMPRSKLTEAMSVLAKVRAKPELKAGDILVHNLLGTGSNVVATSNLPC